MLIFFFFFLEKERENDNLVTDFANWTNYTRLPNTYIYLDTVHREEIHELHDVVVVVFSIKSLNFV